MNVLRRQISLDTDQKWPRPTVWLPLPYAIQNAWVLSRVCYPRIVEPSREGKVYRSGVLLEVQGLIELGPLHSHTPNSLLLELPFLIVSKDESSMILRKKKQTTRRHIPEDSKFCQPREPYISFLNLRVPYRIASLLASRVKQNSEVHCGDLKFLRRFWEVTPCSRVGG